MADSTKAPDVNGDEAERPRRARRGGTSQDPLPVALSGPCRRREHQKPDLARWPASPQLSSGYLVAENSGWRTSRPKIEDSACICCNLCVLLCPDGALANTGTTIPACWRSGAKAAASVRWNVLKTPSQW